MYPARDGDALLIICDQEKCGFFIDGGYAETYWQYILPDLKALNLNGYRLRLVMATHIDADHIGGLVDFFTDNGWASDPSVIPVDAVWHNSLRAMTTSHENTPDADNGKIRDFVKRQSHLAEKSGRPTEISARQGSTLAATLLAGNYHWNEGAGFQKICTSWPAVPPMNISSFQILSPSEERLSALCLWWRRKLVALGFSGQYCANEVFDDAFELLCREDASRAPPPHMISAKTPLLQRDYLPDNSPTNGSSIAFSLTLSNKRMLMLADAWAEEVVTSLKASGVPQHFDIIKISHHGSIRNTSPELLSLIDAPMYLISTDGKKHVIHPDIAVLKAIVDRPATFTRTLFFNYATRASAFMKTYLSASGAPFRVIEGATEWITL